MPLYRKEIDYVSDIQKHIASRHKVKITKKDLLWIIGRILHYAALLLTHGYTFTPSLQATFRMYHTSSDDFKAIEKEARYTGKKQDIQGVQLFMAYSSLLSARKGGWMSIRLVSSLRRYSETE